MNALAMLRHLPTNNLDVAKALAADGWHVFPCQNGGSTPKRPHYNVRWKTQATTDIRQIEAWWKQWPNALPAIFLGEHGLVIVDADRHGGPDGVTAWEELASSHGDAPAPSVLTPSGGQHFYFRQPAGGPELGNNERGLPKGINVRGKGGYVIAPGAILTDGRRYELHGDLENIQEIPAWFVALVKRAGGPEESDPCPAPVLIKPIQIARQGASIPHKAYIEKAVRDELTALADAPKGHSNNALNTAAFALGQMAGAGWISRGQAHGWLEAAAWGNMAIRADGRTQMVNSLHSGLESGMKSPRPMPDDREDVPAQMGGEISRAIVAAHAAKKAAAAIAAPEIVQDQERPPLEFPANLAHPGGFIEEIADWVEATARYPSRSMAIATALSTLGTAIGREWSGPTGSSTVLYTLVLAPTGCGKDHVIEQTSRLFARAGMVDILGPDDFQSANAMSSFVQRKPLSLCVMDEFGAFLARITSRTASSFARDSSAFLRKMWSTKFKLWRSSEYAQKSSVSVWAPAFNVLGLSVPKEFYAALRGADVSNGFFNRFFVIPNEVKPDEREPLLPPEDVPDSISRALTYAMTRGRVTDFKRCAEQEIFPKKIAWGIGGQEADQELKDEIDCRVGSDDDAREFYTRTREMALRIAAIVGFGKDMKMPVVDGETMLWSSRIALWSAEQMYTQFKEYAAETETQALAKEIMRHVTAGCKAHGGKMPHSKLLKKLDHRFKAPEVRGALGLLLMAGDLIGEEGAAVANGKAPIFYRMGES